MKSVKDSLFGLLARSTRGLRRPSLNARSGTPNRPPFTGRENEQALREHKYERAVTDGLAFVGLSQSKQFHRFLRSGTSLGCGIEQLARIGVGANF